MRAVEYELESLKFDKDTIDFIISRLRTHNPDFDISEEFFNHNVSDHERTIQAINIACDISESYSKSSANVDKWRKQVKRSLGY